VDRVVPPRCAGATRIGVVSGRGWVITVAAERLEGAAGAAGVACLVGESACCARDTWYLGLAAQLHRTSINVLYPDSEALHLNLAVGAASRGGTTLLLLLGIGLALWARHCIWRRGRHGRPGRPISADMLPSGAGNHGMATGWLPRVHAGDARWRSLCFHPFTKGALAGSQWIAG
jgi:hypothetical protein